MIEIVPFLGDQMQIRYYKRRVAYCNRKPNFGVGFLPDEWTKLTPDEKTQIIAEVIRFTGKCRPTPQTKEFWPDEDTIDRRDPEGEGH